MKLTGLYESDLCTMGLKLWLHNLIHMATPMPLFVLHEWQQVMLPHGTVQAAATMRMCQEST